jgi:hypothetical protein
MNSWPINFSTSQLRYQAGFKLIPIKRLHFFTSLWCRLVETLRLKRRQIEDDFAISSSTFCLVEYNGISINWQNECCILAFLLILIVTLVIIYSQKYTVVNLQGWSEPQGKYCGQKVTICYLLQWQLRSLIYITKMSKSWKFKTFSPFTNNAICCRQFRLTSFKTRTREI